MRNEQQHFGDKVREIFVLTRKFKLHFNAGLLQPELRSRQRCLLPFSRDQLSITLTSFSGVMKAHYRLIKGNPWYFLQVSKDRQFIKKRFSGTRQKQNIPHQHLTLNPSSLK